MSNMTWPSGNPPHRSWCHCRCFSLQIPLGPMGSTVRTLGTCLRKNWALLGQMPSCGKLALPLESGHLQRRWNLQQSDCWKALPWKHCAFFLICLSESQTHLVHGQQMSKEKYRSMLIFGLGGRQEVKIWSAASVQDGPRKAYNDKRTQPRLITRFTAQRFPILNVSWRQSNQPAGHQALCIYLRFLLLVHVGRGGKSWTGHPLAPVNSEIAGRNFILMAFVFLQLLIADLEDVRAVRAQGMLCLLQTVRESFFLFASSPRSEPLWSLFAKSFGPTSSTSLPVDFKLTSRGVSWHHISAACVRPCVFLQDFNPWRSISRFWSGLQTVKLVKIEDALAFQVTSSRIRPSPGWKAFQHQMPRVRLAIGWSDKEGKRRYCSQNLDHMMHAWNWTFDKWTHMLTEHE